MQATMPVPFSGPLSVTSAASSSYPNGTIFPSAVYAQATGTFYSQEYVNSHWAGLQLIVNLVDKGVNGTLTVSIEVKDPISGTFTAVAEATTGSLASNGIKILTIHPTITTAAGDIDASGFIGNRWRVKLVVGTNDVTASVAGTYLAW